MSEFFCNTSLIHKKAASQGLDPTMLLHTMGSLAAGHTQDGPGRCEQMPINDCTPEAHRLQSSRIMSSVSKMQVDGGAGHGNQRAPDHAKSLARC